MIAALAIVASVPGCGSVVAAGETPSLDRTG